MVEILEQLNNKNGKNNKNIKEFIKYFPGICTGICTYTTYGVLPGLLVGVIIYLFSKFVEFHTELSSNEDKLRKDIEQYFKELRDASFKGQDALDTNKTMNYIRNLKFDSDFKYYNIYCRETKKGIKVKIILDYEEFIDDKKLSDRLSLKFLFKIRILNKKDTIFDDTFCYK